MLRIAIIEDEQHATWRLVEALGRIPDVEIVGEARDGESGLALIGRTAPDVVLLDISLPERTGLEVAAVIAKEGGPLVIFVTAFDRFALNAFEVSATDYVLKPVEVDRLAEALARARKRLTAERAEERVGKLEAVLDAMAARDGRDGPYVREVWVSRRHRSVRLPIDEIHWLEAADDYVRIHTSDEEHLVRGPLEVLVARLDPQQFLRVHRSAAINLRCVEQVEMQKTGALRIVMSNGRRVHVARRCVSTVRRLISSRAGLGVALAAIHGRE